MDCFKDKQIVVLGLAKSGVAISKYLFQLGAKVIASDSKKACPEAAELEKLGIRVICGDHPDDLIHKDIAMVVKNPGIPYTIAPIQKAQQLNIPVVTEVEIAGFFSKSPIVGITGTNGKTTTTVLVSEMLAKGKIPSVAAGNIGVALTEVIQETDTHTWIIAELSSFQLKGTHQFHPRVAALLNIGEAHLDYHHEFSDYVQSKQRLFANQTTEDVAVLNADSPACREMAASISSSILWFSRETALESGVYIQDGKMIWRMEGKAHTIMDIEDIALRGVFNQENALAAAAIAFACKCPIAAIAETLRMFTGVEHRLEYVKTIHGVTYYNDSKATNLQAAKMALGSFDTPVIWLAGGLDRGVDFRELLPVMREKVRGMVVFGQTRDILKERADEASIPCFLVEDIAQAVSTAKAYATEGDSVLLSPACASWDMYTSFEERGSIFKQAVHTL